MGAYSRQAHADFNAAILSKMFLEHLAARGLSEQEAVQMDLMFVNVWRPFAYSVRDNPHPGLDLHRPGE